MIYNNEIASQTAVQLLKIKAVKLNTSNLFTWASGIQSPIYCDNRITLSYPEVRTFIRQQFVKLIEEHFSNPELIAAVATGGIAQGALIAQELGIPLAYVRSQKKDHGLTNQIEGEARAGQRTVVIEDLVSTGSSSLAVVEALRGNGCIVTGMAAIFTYNLPRAEKAFSDAGCKLVTLTDYDHLISTAAATGYIKESDMTILEEFRKKLAE